jgi:hypothetical protein
MSNNTTLDMITVDFSGTALSKIRCKGKGKVHPRTGQEGPEWE